MLRNPEGAPSTPDINIKVKGERSARRTAGLVLGGVAAGAAIAVLATQCSGEQTGTHVEKARVVKIVPATLKCDAIMESDVKDIAWDQPKSPLDHILGAITSPVEHSYSATATFQGRVDTMVCFDATQASITAEPNGQLQETIPTAAIRVASFVDAGKSTTRLDHGDLAALRQAGNTVAGPLPGSEKIKDSEEGGDANIIRISNEEAVNFTDTSCFSAAWPVVKQAITIGEQREANAEYQTQKAQAEAAGETIKNPFKGLVVAFGDTTPHARTPYNLGANVKVEQAPTCEVDPNALQPNGNLNDTPIVDASTHDPVAASWEGFAPYNTLVP